MKRAEEMTGLWKEWKTKYRFPTLSTSPLEISPKARDFHIPSAPATARWESGKPKAGFPLFHRVLKFSKKKEKPRPGPSGPHAPAERSTGKESSLHKEVLCQTNQDHPTIGKCSSVSPVLQVSWPAHARLARQLRRLRFPAGPDF